MAKDGISASFETKDLLKSLKILPSNIQKNVMVGATRAGANVVRDEIRRTVPVLTGQTKKSIKTTKRKGNKNEILFTVSPKRGGKNDGWKMRFIEFGTSKQQPNPVMRKAFESQADESLKATKDYMKKRLPQEIAKAKR